MIIPDAVAAPEIDAFLAHFIAQIGEITDEVAGALVIAVEGVLQL